MNFILQGFRKLSSDRQTDRQTDTTDIIYHAASRVVNKVNVQYMLWPSERAVPV